MTEEQLSELGSIKENVSYTGVSGFDNSVILEGRPYTAAGQFCGSLQYLLMSYLYLLTVDVYVLFESVLAIGNQF